MNRLIEIIGRLRDNENNWKLQPYIIPPFLPTDSPESHTLDLHFKKYFHCVVYIVFCWFSWHSRRLVPSSSSAMAYWHLTGKCAPTAVYLNETAPNSHIMVVDG